MRDVALLLLFFAVVPWILMRPAVGIYTWTLISVMHPHRATWGFAYHFPFAQLTAAFTLVALLLSKEPKKLKGGAAAAVLFVLVCYMSFTTIFAFEPDRANYMLDRVLKIQFMTFVALVALYKREHVLTMVWAMACSVGFYAVKGGIYTIVTAGVRPCVGTDRELHPGQQRSGARNDHDHSPLGIPVYTAPQPALVALGASSARLCCHASPP